MKGSSGLPTGQQRFGGNGLAKAGECLPLPALRIVLVWEEGSSLPLFSFHVP